MGKEKGRLRSGQCLNTGGGLKGQGDSLLRRMYHGERSGSPPCLCFFGKHCILGRLTDRKGGLFVELRYRYTLVDDRLREGICVRMEEGRVVSVTEDNGPSEEGILAPGLIDLHIHGLHGADTMQGADAVRKMAAVLPRYGVTSFLPTTMNAAPEDIRTALCGIRQVMDHPQGGAQVLGAHLEGPFLAETHLGAQGAEFCLLPAGENYDRIADGLENVLRLVTLSPEIQGASELIRRLCARGIVVSAGHTGAGYEEMQEAVESGVTQVTHLFNGMNGLHHRNPGTPGAALSMDELSCQLIADGVHVHPALLKICLRAKGAGRICLITDSMAACGLGDGEYRLGPTRVSVRDGIARTQSGNLAGSTLTLDRAVRNMIGLAGASPTEALRMASGSPADALHLASDRGRIAPGLRADLAVFDADYRVRRTYTGGRLCFNGESL